MSKSKKAKSTNLKQLLTEKNLSILLLVILVACVAVLLTRENMRTTKLIDPVDVEQVAPPEEAE
jgi:hypothetical protein